MSRARSRPIRSTLSHLLYLNGIVREHDVLDAATLVKVRMPNREGFVTDARPDVGPRARSKPR
jgi:hypothetical protein